MTLNETYNKWLSLQPLTEDEQRVLSMRFTVEYNYNSNHLEGNRLTQVSDLDFMPFEHMLLGQPISYHSQ